jgi:hypothetical protein
LFAVAALSERRNPLRIQDRRSETAATRTTSGPGGLTFARSHDSMIL